MFVYFLFVRQLKEMLDRLIELVPSSENYLLSIGIGRSRL